MSFLYGELLTLLLFIPLIYIYLKKYKKKLTLKLSSDFNKLLTLDRFLKYRVYALLLALTLSIIALARPVIEIKDTTIKNYGVDIIIAVDISASMSATDLSPNRFEFAKEKLKKFINLDKTDRYAMLVFSKNALILSPLSEDRELLYYLFDSINLESVTSKSTNFMPPLKKTKELIKTKEKILILFTDGGEKEYFEREIAFARENHIKVFVLGTATPKGIDLKQDAKNLTDKNGNIVISSLNNSIKALAHSTGGEFIKATKSDMDIKSLHREIKSVVEKRLLKETQIKDYRELFYYFIIGAILLFFIAIFSFEFKKASLLFLLLLTPKVEAGMFDFYYANEYKKALSENNLYLAKKYLKKLEDNRAYYNLGVLHYRDGEYKEALQSFLKIKSSNTKFKSKVFYNIANSYSKLREYKKADEFYLKSLLLVYDRDADYNREFIREFAKETKVKEIKLEKLIEVKKESNESREYKLLSKKEVDKLEESLMSKLEEVKRPLSFKQYKALNKGSRHEENPW